MTWTTLLHWLSAQVLVNRPAVVRLAILLGCALVAYALRRQLPRWVSPLIGIVITVGVVRVLLFDNTLALTWYLQSQDSRQRDTLAIAADSLSQKSTRAVSPLVAVGSSQVGGIFSHWVSDAGLPMKVFSLAGMKAIDYVLFEHEIAAHRPRFVLLYLSAFDVAAAPELRTLPLAPPHPSLVIPIMWRLHTYHADAGDLAVFIHQYLAAQAFPEYRFSFVFKELLRSASRPRIRHDIGPASGLRVLDPGQPPGGASTRATREIRLSESVQPTGRAATTPAPLPVPADKLGRFESNYRPEWIDFNMSFLVDFVEFCQSRGIQVVLNEGQISPEARTPRIQTLHRLVAARFEEMALKFPNLLFVHANDVHEFAQDEYEDYTHVGRPAARRFTRALSSYLECRVGLSGAQGPCSFRFEGGWHPAERNEASWLRWSDGIGRLSFVLREPTDVLLDAEVLSLRRPNVIDVVIDGRHVSSWQVTERAWAFYRPPPVRFRANSGQTVVEFISREPAESQPTDPRRLAFALRNVGITAGDGTRLCDLQMGNCP